MTETTATTAQVTIDEDLDHTEARVTFELKGIRMTGHGRARRNPVDPSMPVVGEELATARAFSDLAHKLVEAAAETISGKEGRPANVRL
jgi:Domain of unknown function (DUF1876)